MNQAEHRSRIAEIQQAELVPLAAPSEQAHFGEGGEVFARCYGMARAWGRYYNDGLQKRRLMLPV